MAWMRRLLIGFAVVALACATLASAPPERASATTDCSLTAPASITQSNDPNQAGAVVTYPAPTVSGTCSTVTCSPASGSFYPLGTTLVICSAATTPVVRGGFTIRVNDTQPPLITVPPNKTVANDPGKASAVVTFNAPMVSDNAPGVTFSCNHVSGSLFPLGTTGVTCTARDGSGNTAGATFNVTVNDTEAPVIELAPDVNATVAFDAASGIVGYNPPAAHDNSGTNPSVNCNPPSGSTFLVGTTSVICSTADAAGNPASKTFSVIVSRAAPPVTAPPIDNVFALGKPKLDRRKGTARLPVTVPGPGTIALEGEDVVSQRSVRRRDARAAKPVVATVKLIVEATGEAKQTLKQTGKATVTVTVTYTPTGGTPSTQTTSVKLRKRR